RHHLAGAELVERSCDRLHRALHVALDDERELLLPGLFELLHHLLERTRRAGAAQRLAPLADAVVGDLAGPRLVLDDGDLIARLGSRVETEDLDRHRRPGAFHVLALVVDQRPHAAPRRAGNDDVADVQRAALDEHRAHRATPALELRLDDDTLG